MKLLLHACCGPCACYPTEQLTAAGTDFDILFFNPNIHPYKEFKHRLSTLREFCEKKRYNLIIDKSYPIEECIRGMLSEPTVRCAFCYRMRLRYAAQFAKENGYDAFSTTLLVSPYQKHELIKKEQRRQRRSSVFRSITRTSASAISAVWISAWSWGCIASSTVAVSSASATATKSAKSPRRKQRRISLWL